MIRCRRLSLTPLCFLWQRDQAELLSEMIDAGLVAILIKVAGMGLTTKHLSQTLGQMQPILTKLVGVSYFVGLHRSDSFPELALWIAHLWGRWRIRDSDTRLSIVQTTHSTVRVTLQVVLSIRTNSRARVETETVIHSDNDFATVAYLRVLKASLQDKVECQAVDPTIPPLLEEKFHSVQDDVLATPSTPMPKPAIHPVQLTIRASPSVDPNRKWLAFTDIQCSSNAGQSVEDEARECFRLLLGMLLLPFSLYIAIRIACRKFAATWAGLCSLYKHQSVHIVDGIVWTYQRNLFDILRK